MLKTYYCGEVNLWRIARLCLEFIESSQKGKKEIILPKDDEISARLAKFNFEHFLQQADLEKYKIKLPSKINETNKDIQEIIFCGTKDEFEARLEKFKNKLLDFGFNLNQAQIATAIIGELGNNVFDHNLGSWPLNIGGAIILGQNFPNKKEVKLIVADPGIGFKNSLKHRKPKNEIEAIRLGLKGVSGWVGVKRGNGLKIIQDWTINRFSGILKIQSGDGLVILENKRTKSRVEEKITGTIVEITLRY